VGFGAEIAAAADHVLPHPRLRLVDAQADGLAGRRVAALARQALLVERVAALVQAGVEAGPQVRMMLPVSGSGSAATMTKPSFIIPQNSACTLGSGGFLL